MAVANRNVTVIYDSFHYVCTYVRLKHDQKDTSFFINLNGSKIPFKSDNFTNQFTVTHTNLYHQHMFMYICMSVVLYGMVHVWN